MMYKQTLRFWLCPSGYYLETHIIIDMLNISITSTRHIDVLCEV